jgi:hypothetical protein
MPLMERIRKLSRRILFGDPSVPQEFTIGLCEPQMEVSVWLHGSGNPIDVTRRLATACCAPLMVCIGLDETEMGEGRSHRRASLKFCERDGRRRVLGEIRLTLSEILSVGDARFVLFRVDGSTNHCLPRLRLWALYASHAYHQWRWVKNPDVKMTQMEQRAAMVTFIRPHPLVLVSLQGAGGGNIFPMNLMGDLGNGYFGFALKDSRMAAHLVERERRLALSSVPLAKSSLAYSYAIHHTKTSIDWDTLPFSLKLSKVFSIPFPEFALRVRELEIESITKGGSHTFFVARIVSDTRLSEALQVNVIHGFYQALRLKGQKARLLESIAEDSINKKGVQPEAQPGLSSVEKAARS